ncbi:hypothetical protein [Paenibacillus sp. LHD-38]|uniref:hypothetical protein n=1 Tax=Paenibacillus sp. LHD-38 TaxID=3072143 RepID=UPI00280F3919|nr:hypothetical protein [Paenibacillus sp. LHD-38]MDQ8734340.1 hypothetical protein [Paenibacillus sp. LHD-38]
MLKVILATCILFFNQTPPLHEDKVIQFVNEQYGIIIRGIYSEHRDYISNFTVAFNGKQSEIFQWRRSKAGMINAVGQCLLKTVHAAGFREQGAAYFTLKRLGA